MTKRWKLKTNSSNILLVLITLILVKAEWVEAEKDDFLESINDIENNYSGNENDQIHAYVGNDEIAHYFFQTSINDNSLILNGINKCLDSFQLITCVKMLLLNKVNDVLNLMEKEGNVSQKDFRLLNGILIFKAKNGTVKTDSSEMLIEDNNLSLDEEIAIKVKKIFRKRSLLVNLLKNIKIEVEPAFEQRGEDFIFFKYKNIGEESGLEDQNYVNKGRKKKGGGMSMMMMVPQLIMLGLMPFTLASLKAMVMNAVMINMMALNGAIFMTIRNLVFGPRKGDNVKYVNYGYSKNRQTKSRKPVLIVHSPAAFVKQPPVHKKQVDGHSSHHSTLSYFPESHYSNADSSFYYQNSENNKDYGNDYYYVQHLQDDSNHNRKQEGIQKRNEPLKMRNRDKINVSRQNIYQRKFVQEGVTQNTPPFRKTPNGNSHRTNENFHYSGGNIKRKDSTTRYQTLGSLRELKNEKAEFKPSPQWDFSN